MSQGYSSDSSISGARGSDLVLGKLTDGGLESLLLLGEVETEPSTHLAHAISGARKVRPL